jgi:hypothetical protein
VLKKQKTKAQGWPINSPAHHSTSSTNPTSASRRSCPRPRARPHPPFLLPRLSHPHCIAPTRRSLPSYRDRATPVGTPCPRLLASPSAPLLPAAALVGHRCLLCGVCACAASSSSSTVVPKSNGVPAVPCRVAVVPGSRQSPTSPSSPRHPPRPTRSRRQAPAATSMLLHYFLPQDLTPCCLI